MSASNPTPGRQRLDSWKEIAAFFDRDERTVNRWEKERGLPVHRLPGAKGRVYAYAEELSAWLATPRNADPDPSADVTASVLQPESSRLIVIPSRNNPVEAVLRDGPPPATELQAEPTGKPPRILGQRVAAALSIGAVAVLLLFHSRAGHGSSQTGRTISSSAAPARVVMASAPAHDPEAEQLYLKGRYYWNKRTPKDLKQALDYFTQAVVHDPNYASAYVGLADCYNLLREYSEMPEREAYPRALAAAKKAVELDDQSSEAHASLAFVTFFGMLDVVGGEREFRRAIDLNPNNARSHHWYANALIALHRYPEALTEIDRAQTLDPTSSSILADKGNILAAVGRRDEALTLLRQMEDREPAFLSPHTYLKYMYFDSRQYPEFLRELRKESVLTHNNSALSIADAAEKGFATGGAQGMFGAIFQVQKRLYARHDLSAIDLAQTSAALGKKDQALRYLKAAYEQRDSSLLYLESDSQLDGLHREPAYQDLLARMNLPAQN